MQTLPIEEIASFQPKGVLTIPKKIRDAVGLAGRAIVRIRADRGKITIEPVYTTPYPVRTFTDEEINEWLELDTLEGEDLRKKGLMP